MAAWGIVIVGIVLRLKIYLDNRSFYLDEVNVARNIYERNFIELLKPLNYEQFAPPGFLWVVKLSTLLFGYSEYAYILFPLLCSMAAFYLLLKILRYFSEGPSVLYSLFLFATGFIYLFYAVTLKQYSSDIFFALAVILVALKTDITKLPSWKFIMLWTLVATLGMWFSMIAVFILSGVIAYYFCLIARERKWSQMGVFVLTGLIWLSLFSLYYFLFLKSAIGSSYLQGFHKPYFIELWPGTTEVRDRNIDLLNDIITNAAGDTVLAIAFNLLLLIVGLVYLLRKHTAKGLLLLIPIISLYVASGLHQFTLLPRVVQFIMPLLFILITVGLEQIVKFRSLPVRLVAMIAAVICMVNFGQFHYFYERMQHEEYKVALDIAKQEGITGERLHVDGLIEPVHIYYTQIHPGKVKWSGLRNVNIINWGSTYDTIASHMTKDMVFYGWFPEDELQRQLGIYRRYCDVTAFDVPGMHVYVCGRKKQF